MEEQRLKAFHTQLKKLEVALFSIASINTVILDTLKEHKLIDDEVLGEKVKKIQSEILLLTMETSEHSMH